jgi:hypothetical protein
MMPTMSDQPTDQGDRPAGNHRPTTGDHAPVPIEAAAERLGITVNAVRQRIKRGTIEGYRTPAGWVVVVDRPTTDRPPTRATDHRPTTGDQPTDQRPTTTDQAPAVDLAPLADVISTLTRENRQLAEAAAAWQIRAMQAEERLKQLTAGDDGDQDAPTAAPAAPGAAEPPEPAPDAPAPWWRFWERRR